MVSHNVGIEQDKETCQTANDIYASSCGIAFCVYLEDLSAARSTQEAVIQAANEAYSAVQDKAVFAYKVAINIARAIQNKALRSAKDPKKD